MRTKSILLIGAAIPQMSIIERRMGRLMRAPDGHVESGGVNNGGENSGGGSNDSENQNNAGEVDELASFWDSPEDDDEDVPNGGADADDSQSSGHPLVTELNTSLTNMKFDSLLTPELMEKMGEGDFAGFNEGMNTFGQKVARQTLGLAVNVMKAVEVNILERVRSEMAGTIQNDKSFTALEAAIPASTNPKTAPLVRQIYTKALQNSKGDIKAAIAQTKSVMQIQAEVFGGDLNLDVAPRNSRDGSPPPKVTDWLEELNAS